MQNKSFIDDESKNIASLSLSLSLLPYYYNMNIMNFVVLKRRLIKNSAHANLTTLCKHIVIQFIKSQNYFINLLNMRKKIMYVNIAREDHKNPVSHKIITLRTKR